MKKVLTVVALGLTSVVALTGCSEHESYNDYLIKEQIKCTEAGGHLEVYRDGYMANGKSVLCILPGTEVHLEKKK